MVELIVIGGCVIDLVSYVDKFPVPGETTVGSKFLKGFGGKGANQAVMASRLGLKTAMISKIGDDSFGTEFLQCLKRENINTDYMVVSNQSHTSTANIAVASGGQNQIVYIPGAGGLLTAEEVLKAEPLFASEDLKLVVGTYETPEPALWQALTLARKYKVQTFINAAPPTPTPLIHLYSLINIFCINETELEAATRHKAESIDQVQLAITQLQSQGCTTVIASLGSRGAVVAENQHLPDLVPAEKVEHVVDTTGAGDALVGSLAYYLVKHPQLGLPEQTRRACAIASLSVTRPGTQTSYPQRAELPNSLFSN